MYTFYCRFNNGKYYLSKFGWIRKEKAIDKAEYFKSLGAIEMYRICYYRSDYGYEDLEDMVYCLNHKEDYREKYPQVFKYLKENNYVDICI